MLPNLVLQQNLYIGGETDLLGNVTIAGNVVMEGPLIVGNVLGNTVSLGYAWHQIGSDIDGEAVDDNSGYSVALSSSGNTVAIGAPNNDGNGLYSGHTRVYYWSGSAWIQRGSDIDGEAVQDHSGFSVAISSDGNVVAIGAPYNDGNGSTSGHTRVYYWSGSAWIQRGSDIDGEAAGDLSGYNVAMSSDGNSVAIGAIFNDGNGSNSGHVRVYDWSGSVWIQRGSDIDGEAANDQSGLSVAMSSDGNIVAIGAPLNDGNAPASGHVRVYDWSGGAWVQRGSDIDGNALGDEVGWSVALSSNGNTVATCGRGGNYSQVYDWSGGVWVQRGSNIAISEPIHIRLSDDGNILAVVARNDITYVPNFQVYGWTGSVWMLRGLEIEPDSLISDVFSVAMSSDGTVVAIGDNGNDGNGTGVFTGHTRVFRSLPIEIFTETAIQAVGQIYIDDGSSTNLVTASFNDTTTWSYNAIRPYQWATSTPTTMSEALDRIANAYYLQHGSLPLL